MLSGWCSSSKRVSMTNTWPYSPWLPGWVWQCIFHTHPRMKSINLTTSYFQGWCSTNNSIPGWCSINDNIPGWCSMKINFPGWCSKYYCISGWCSINSTIQVDALIRQDKKEWNTSECPSGCALVTSLGVSKPMLSLPLVGGIYHTTFQTPFRFKDNFFLNIIF